MLNPLEGLVTKRDIADIAASENLILDDEDRISVLESMESIDIQACPGSGKTTLIATKLILLAKKWPFHHQGICVLSHTNVAKDELIDKLKKSSFPDAHSLLSYPHFIGTIQDFVDKYLALPVVRELTGFTKFLEHGDAIGEVWSSSKDINSLCKSLYQACGGPKPYDQSFHKEIRQFVSTVFWLNKKNDIGFYGSYGKLKTYRNDPKKKIYPKLEALKKSMVQKGLYQYRDMYAYAQKIIYQNISLASCLQKRFPIVFIDEMQDTQKFQDELLLQIFPLDEPDLMVQRFGDPDQAIFHGIDGEEPNSSFNGKLVADMDFVINTSHRFDNDIAEKVRGVSFNEVSLETELTDNSRIERTRLHANGQNFEHTLIIYRDETRTNVIPEFADIVSRQFSETHKRSDKFSIKVVGAVGNEIDPEKDQLKIGHYWAPYDKAKTKNNFKEGSFIEAVHYCRQSPSGDWAANYKLLTDCILKLLRRADKRSVEGRYYSTTSMREFLKAKGEWENYRKLIHMMLSDDHQVDREFWSDTNQVLSVIFDFNSGSVELAEYLAFHDGVRFAEPAHEGNEPKEGTLTPLPGNMIQHPDGFRVELSTIHGVKGETHDATLVLETKYYCFDLETMMPYLTGDLPNHKHPNVNLGDNPRTFKPNKKFMRQFYVAMSRPKHLLCLAVHSNRITPKHRASLEAADWLMRDLALDG